MKSYKDAKGVTWDLVLTVQSARKIRSRLNVDVLDNNSLAAATGDPLVCCDILWVLCEDQAATRGVSEDQFYVGVIEGETFEDASVALLEELADFFLRLGRRLMAQMIRQTLQARPKMKTAVTNQMPAMAEMVTRMIDQAETELATAFASSPGR